jgi:hypothetical protein
LVLVGSLVPDDRRSLFGSLSGFDIVAVHAGLLAELVRSTGQVVAVDIDPVVVESVLSGSNPWVFTNAYSAGNGTNDNTLQENWYNSGGAQMPNAEERNNRLIDNVQVNGNDWPSAAWEVICAAGVAPEYRTELNANLGGIDPRCETVAATETP